MSFNLPGGCATTFLRLHGKNPKTLAILVVRFSIRVVAKIRTAAHPVGANFFWNNSPYNNLVRWCTMSPQRQQNCLTPLTVKPKMADNANVNG